MRLGIRLLFGFFLITGLAGFFVMRVFVQEVKPSVRQVMEDMMVDTANILAELATEDVVNGHVANGRFAQQVDQYARRSINARIWGVHKQTLDFRVYVTNTDGKVLFDSTQQATGQDYSQWRDVVLTLRGEYGARSTREVESDDRTSVMHVAAPIWHQGRIVGVLTVAKPNASVQAFIERAEQQILRNGLLLLALSASVGVVVTLWTVWSIRRLRRYANAVQAGSKEPVPQVPGELGELARAMEAMRMRVEQRDYMEAYVRALTHELKSPLAAIRGATELLQDELPAADRQAFAHDVLAQTQRLQTLVERMLALSKLEQRHEPLAPQPLPMPQVLNTWCEQAQAQWPHIRLRVQMDTPEPSGLKDAASAQLPTPVLWADPELLTLALNNLVGNAADFAPSGSEVVLHAQPGGLLSVQDQGPGVPDFALPKLGTRFFSTVRPDGHTKGTGLGLAIVQQIMHLHGGQFQARNTQPGLRVTLTFPVL